MKLSDCKSRIFSYLLILSILFNLTACGGSHHSDGPGNTGCKEGINNTVCSADLLEDSLWQHGPVKTSADFDGETYVVELSHFYKFNSADQSYEHYIFLKEPSTNSWFTERRHGSVNLLNNSKEIEFTLTGSTCSGEDSIFSIFDRSGERLEVIRNGENLYVERPAPAPLEDYINSIELKVDTIENVIVLPLKMLQFLFAVLFSAVLSVFTPEFIENFVTGAFWYDDNTMTYFQERYDNRIEGCFSPEGIERFIKN